MKPWDDKKPDFSKYEELRPYSFPKDVTLACAWDEKSFGIFSTSDEEIGYLHEIYDAFFNSDGVVFLGGREMLGNGGVSPCHRISNSKRCSG